MTESNDNGARKVPDACDCCGRDAEDCGMLDVGWVLDVRKFAFGGTYCRGCAHLLRLIRWSEQCAWCAMPIDDEDKAEEDGWRYYSNRLGELHACCPGCLTHHFGIKPSAIV